MPSQPVSSRGNIHDLHYSIQVGGVLAVEALVEGVDINTTVCGSTALSLALYREKPDIFSLLLTHPSTRSLVDVNKVSKDDKQRLEPPLITACRLGNREAVKLLLKRKDIDLEGKDNFQHTAMWMATRQRYTDIVQLLIKSGASVNPSYKYTHSPLFFATKYSSKRTDIARLLLINGASVDLHPGGPSLLFCAIVQGNLHMARLIVEAGYNVSKDDKIKQEFSASTLTRNQSLIVWLKQEVHQPPCLQRQCRTAIRRCLIAVHNGRHFLDCLQHLPLPSSVKNFLSLQGPMYDPAQF